MLGSPAAINKRMDFTAVTRLQNIWQLAFSPFWLLILFLVFVFFTGGGSRADIQSLVVLRPVAVMMCGIGLMTLRWSHVVRYQTIFWITLAIFLTVASHLVPLPPSVWQGLPGRQLLSEVDQVAGIGQIWRPLSVVPATTWNALYALFVPLAVLIFGAQLNGVERVRLVSAVMLLGVLSGFWGVLQTISAPDSPLYLYQITTDGTAVGLFANRNHQEALLACLFPMLATYATMRSRTEDIRKMHFWIAIALGIFLVPLLLVTGSRTGIVLGIIGLIFAALSYWKTEIISGSKRKPSTLTPRLTLIVIGVLCLSALTAIMSRAEAFRRLSGADQIEDLRFRMWGPIVDMAGKYFPFGSGVGSFVEVYQIDEPTALLSSSYVNHAHNDWLEVLLTAGLPGGILLAVATAAFFRAAYQLLGSSKCVDARLACANLGAAIITIFALASLVDYPLRTPSIACVFVIATIWLAGAQTGKVEKAGGS